MYLLRVRTNDSKFNYAIFLLHWKFYAAWDMYVFDTLSDLIHEEVGADEKTTSSYAYVRW